MTTRPQTRVVSAHLDYLGLDSTNSDTADRLELIVLTMPADESKRADT